MPTDIVRVSLCSFLEGSPEHRRSFRFQTGWFARRRASDTYFSTIRITKEKRKLLFTSTESVMGVFCDLKTVFFKSADHPQYIARLEKWGIPYTVEAVEESETELPTISCCRCTKQSHLEWHGPV